MGREARPDGRMRMVRLSGKQTRSHQLLVGPQQRQLVPGRDDGVTAGTRVRPVPALDHDRHQCTEDVAQGACGWGSALDDPELLIAHPNLMERSLRDGVDEGGGGKGGGVQHGA